MIYKIFTVFDAAAQAHLPPFFLHAEGQATRTFGNCVNDETHQFAANPDDYTLFHIGHYDDENAKITAIEPVSLGNGVTYLRLAPPAQLKEA